MIQPRLESNDQGRDLIRNDIKPGTTLPDNQINEKISEYMQAVSLYRLKLIGAIWFAGDIQIDQDMTIQVREMSSEEIRQKTKPYVGVTRSILQSLCKLVQIPDWAASETDD
jgi:hypothetical protein